MPQVTVETFGHRELLSIARQRWEKVRHERPDLGPAIDLQSRLLTIVVETGEIVQSTRLPRLSLPPKYLAAKLGRGVPILAGEPIPVPVSVLKPALLGLCEALASGGAGDAATRISEAVELGRLDAASLLTASLARDQTAVREGAVHQGLAPDLLWLAAELATGPFAYALQRALLAAPRDTPDALSDAREKWTAGYCPLCGSWPAIAEVVGGHRGLRCSFCALAWELPSYSCIYCGEDGEAFVTAAPDQERTDRRLELCGACRSYMKTVDVEGFSPFPLVAIADMETMDLDLAAMEHGYSRPPLREFAKR